MTEKMKVPVEAMKFRGIFALQAKADHEGEGDDDDHKFVPFEMVARSPDPIDHFFFGKTVHDLDGVTHNTRIAVDWLHDPDVLVGFANKFTVTDDGLVLGGAVTSIADGDRAAKIIAQSKAGIPFEASIDFTPRMPGDTLVERLDEGEVKDVNGKEVEGPALIFKQWPLARVAIVPSGADANTSTRLLGKPEDEDIELTILNAKEETMSEQTRTDETGEVQSDIDSHDQLEDGAATDGAGEVEEDGTQDSDTTSDESVADERSEFDQFVEQFGHEKAAHYYAERLSLVEATARFCKDLQDENTTLKAAQVSDSDAVSTEGNDAAQFNASEERDGAAVTLPHDDAWYAKYGVDADSLRELSAKNKAADKARRKENKG